MYFVIFLQIFTFCADIHTLYNVQVCLFALKTSRRISEQR